MSAFPASPPSRTIATTWPPARNGWSRIARKSAWKRAFVPTAGHPVVVAKTPRPAHSAKPSFLVYGHYDVQPAEPFELWKSPPFEPRIEGRSLFARGASDNKGQNLAHLNAVEAYLATPTPNFPAISPSSSKARRKSAAKAWRPSCAPTASELACRAVVISDTGMPGLKHPALTYALRGICAVEVTLHGPSRDLHSGIFGGTVDNPAMALCQMLAHLRDKNGRIDIPGFYDDVAKLSAYERKQMAALPMNGGRNIANSWACRVCLASAATLSSSSAAPGRPWRSTA